MYFERSVKERSSIHSYLFLFVLSDPSIYHHSSRTFGSHSARPCRKEIPWKCERSIGRFIKTNARRGKIKIKGFHAFFFFLQLSVFIKWIFLLKVWYIKVIGSHGWKTRKGLAQIFAQITCVHVNTSSIKLQGFLHTMF